MNRIGGAEMVSIDLANHLSKDYDITVISTVEIEDEIPYHIEPTLKVMSLGIPKRVERVDVLTKKYLKHFRIFSLIGLYLQVAFHYFIKRPIYRKRLYELISKDDAILICSAVDSYLLAPKKGHVYFHFHFDTENFFAWNNYPVFKISRKPEKWIFLTNSTMQEVCEKRPKLKHKSLYIHNPVRFQRTFDMSYHNNTILFAGRFNTQKNPMLALAVAKELKDREFPFVLKMFGDPIMKKKMDKYIAENHLEDVVELHGPTNNIHDEMSNSDLLLITSLYEGFCLVMAEANALSRPWVSSNWGPILNEVFVEGKSGVIVPDDDVKKYADAIIEYLSDKEKLKEAKRNAYEASASLSYENILPYWHKLFDQE